MDATNKKKCAGAAWTIATAGSMMRGVLEIGVSMGEIV